MINDMMRESCTKCPPIFHKKLHRIIYEMIQDYEISECIDYHGEIKDVGDSVRIHGTHQMLTTTHTSSFENSMAGAGKALTYILGTIEVMEWKGIILQVVADGIGFKVILGGTN